jgi:pyruvate dehydrogenase E2 component (dihydrolipoamide acetyltransferase)
VVGKLEESAHRWEETPFVASVTQPTTKPTTVKAQPAARLLATQMEVDLHLVTPTGPQGLITTADVKQFLQEQANSPFNKMKALTGKKEALHGVRRHMAEIMVQSHKEIVPATIIDDADITAWPAESDVTAQLLTAIAQAVLIEPALNAWFDGKALERKLFSAVHIGLALDTAEGLFVPVVKNVEIKSKTELRKEVNHFKEATKTRSLLATEMQGASIILSNFGTLAGRYATPIIVPPMVAIIGCGRSYEAACFREGKVVAGRLLPLSLTFDHRAVTGAEASRFLRAIITNLQ